MTRQRAAVIGGTGFIGSHLVEHLVAEGHQVLVVARSDRRLSNLEYVDGSYQFVEADIRDRSGILRALREFRPEAVFHLAAEADGPETVEHMRACVEHNTCGTLNLLEAAHSSEARLFIYADSSKVYGNGPVPFHSSQPEAPICSYAVAKSAAWRLCKLFAERTQLQVVSLRPTFVYGARQNFNLITYVQQAVSRGENIKIQGGRQTRDLLYVGDSVACFAAMMNAEAAWGHSLPIGGGREISVVEICREVLDVLGSNAEIVENGCAARTTEIWRSYCDNKQIEELCGWTPSVSLREGLTRALRLGLYSTEPFRVMRAVAS